MMSLRAQRGSLCLDRHVPSVLAMTKMMSLRAQRGSLCLDRHVLSILAMTAKMASNSATTA
jgi:hypothetical protein